MMRFMKTYRAHRLIPCAATVLTLTVAAQLKVEHSCSQEPYPPPQTSPSLIYPYPEILGSGQNMVLAFAAVSGIGASTLHPLRLNRRGAFP